MSGFEIAGVILGAIPLAISALQNYKAGKGAWHTLKMYHGEVHDLIENLKTQRFHFRMHIHNLLKDAGVEKAIQGDLSEEECACVIQTEQTKGKVAEYFGEMLGGFLDVLGKHERCLKEIVLKLKNISRTSKAEKDDLAAIIATFKSEAGALVFKKRLKFLLSKRFLEVSIDKLHKSRESLDKVIKDMKSLREPVGRVLQEPQEPSENALRLAHIFKRVPVKARPLFEACACRCVDKHRVLMKLDSRVVSQRELGYSITFNLVFDLGMGLQEAFIRTAQTEQAMDDGAEVLDKDMSTSTKHAAAMNPLIHIIDTDLENSNGCSNRSAKARHICDHAYEAQSSNNILQLQLVKHDLSLLKEPAKSSRELLHPVTLERCLRNGTQNEMAQMTLPQRNLLALDIAAGILQLRQTCWFKSPFHNKGIKLFSDNWENVRIAMLEPFIEQVMEESPLKWSDAIGGPDPKMALLELAILLLELWNHEPLEARTGLAGNEPEDARRKAAVKWEEDTETKLLEEHITAIDFCFSISSGRSRSWDDIRFLRDYCENIIMPLHELCKPYIMQTRLQI
ncbi:hypothetical protein GGR53DRAFT_198094 [Hypoxylon sp. FL1150]|nr:hypothetical protein GGR53DRAFT_198094 [Hypoxylon sp. FL1150]